MNTLRCDILILGAGPAGMAAALSAAACDKQVIILDDNPAPGGQIWRAGPQATLFGLHFFRYVLGLLQSHLNITLLHSLRY